MFLCDTFAKHSSYRSTKQENVVTSNIMVCTMEKQSLTLILFSDEVRFYLSRHVDLQNNKNWSARNPVLIHEVPLHSMKVSVWCAVSATGNLMAIFQTTYSH